MLGPLELTVMEILWDTGEGTVHDVAQRLERPLAYTTVMTTLDRLYKKGFLARDRSERAFRYAPRVTRADWERRRTGDLLAGVFRGAPPSGDLLISCFVDLVGREDAALLDELERKIRLKRKELEEGRRT